MLVGKMIETLARPDHVHPAVGGGHRHRDRDGLGSSRPLRAGPSGRPVRLPVVGTVGDPGTFTLFRRAKLWFDGIDPDVLAAALTSGLLVARLGLTDAHGHPLCAAVRPPLIQWSAPGR